MGDFCNFCGFSRCEVRGTWVRGQFCWWEFLKGMSILAPRTSNLVPRNSYLETIFVPPHPRILHSHAAGSAQRGEDCRDDACKNLQECLPTFFLHSRLVFVLILRFLIRGEGFSHQTSAFSPLLSLQPSALFLQPSAFSPQPSALSHQPSALTNRFRFRRLRVGWCRPGSHCRPGSGCHYHFRFGFGFRYQTLRSLRPSARYTAGY